MHCRLLGSALVYHGSSIHMHDLKATSCQLFRQRMCNFIMIYTLRGNSVVQALYSMYIHKNAYIYELLHIHMCVHFHEHTVTYKHTFMHGHSHNTKSVAQHSTNADCIYTKKNKNVQVASGETSKKKFSFLCVHIHAHVYNVCTINPGLSNRLQQAVLPCVYCFVSTKHTYIYTHMVSCFETHGRWLSALHCSAIQALVETPTWTPNPFPHVET